MLNYTVQKIETLFFFFAALFKASNFVWNCNSKLQCQTPCNTRHHRVPRQQQRPNSPLASHVSRLKQHLERVDRHVRSRVNAPANVCELFQALKQEWVAI